MKNSITMLRSILVVLVCMLSLLLSKEALAEVWICSVGNAVSCNDRGEIGEPDLGHISRPTFLRVDTDKKTVAILGPVDRRGEVSAVDTLLQLDYGWLLTGSDSGIAWTMVINEAGHMTLSVTGDGEVWSVFGNAIREEAVSLPE